MHVFLCFETLLVLLQLALLRSLSLEVSATLHKDAVTHVILV